MVKPIEDLREISRIAYGFMASKALFSALQLDVFSRLEKRPQTERELAADAGVAEPRTQTLLSALASWADRRCGRPVDERACERALSGDGIAGRLRRVLQVADRRAGLSAHDAPHGRAPRRHRTPGRRPARHPDDGRPRGRSVLARATRRVSGDLPSCSLAGSISPARRDCSTSPAAAARSRSRCARAFPNFKPRSLTFRTLSGSRVATSPKQGSPIASSSYPATPSTSAGRALMSC